MKNLVSIDYTKKFQKALKKAPLAIKKAFRQRFALFLQDRYYPILENHSLTGKLTGMRSINITGDWRALYSENFDENGVVLIIFEAIGTHSQLYK